MQKIVLIRPESILMAKNSAVPTGLLELGTVLEKSGYSVKIIDAGNSDNYEKTILEECKDAFLVGVTALTSELKSAYNITKMVKNNFKVPIVWGGVHPTLFPKQTCEDPLVDFVIIHEGEDTLLELLEELKGKKDFEKVKGLVWKKGKAITVNPKRDFMDINKLPRTNFELIDMEKYINFYDPSGHSARWLQYQSSRGCPHRCRFCINSVTGDNKRYRTKSAKKVLDELEYFIKKYKINFVNIIDDNFFVDRKRVRDICEGILKRKFNIIWRAECRADYFRKGFVDDDLLALAKKSGLEALTIGAESGSPKMLGIMCKDIKIEHIYNCVETCDRHGVLPEVSFIIGFFDEELADIKMTLNMIKRFKTLGYRFTYGINTFRPYPKCELSEDLIKKGLLKEPKTLKEWSSERVMRIYTQNIRQPWHIDSEFIYNLAYYGKLGGMIAEPFFESIGRIHGMKDLLDWFFIQLAIFRMKHIFLSFPIDRIIYDSRIPIYKKIKKIMGK